MYLEDNRTRVKVCGITTLEDARFASGALVDYLGFIFVENSPRYIAPEMAAEIIGWVEGPQCVGVFADKSPGEINAIALESGIHLVQLHGNETPEDCFNITLPVIKAFRIKPEMSYDDVLNMVRPYRDVADYLLFDSWDKEALGGTGKTFDWNILKDIADDYPYFLAGGLNPSNVRDAIKKTGAYAVDLSSSLELRPGVKDFDLIQELMDEMQEIWELQETEEL
jgi:phosphoribosylanthranilate isomerase